MLVKVIELCWWFVHIFPPSSTLHQFVFDIMTSRKSITQSWHLNRVSPPHTKRRPLCPILPQNIWEQRCARVMWNTRETKALTVKWLHLYQLEKTLLQQQTVARWNKKYLYGNWIFFSLWNIIGEKMHSLYDDILSVFNGTVFGCVGRDAFCWTVVSSLAIVINDRTNSIRDTIYGSRTIWQGFIKSLPKKWTRGKNCLLFLV